MKFSIFVIIGSLLIPKLQADQFTPFFEKHCTDCHDSAARKGDFDITALKPDFTNPDSFAKWLMVHDHIQSGEMPPKKKDRPEATERADLLDWLGKEMAAAEAAKGGRTTVRRMNRTEYEHTLRDLLHLPRLNVKALLPEDGQQFGFDKVAGALDISHVQMTKYLEVADAALRQATVPAGTRPETTTWRQPAATQGSLGSAIAVHCAIPLKGHALLPGLRTVVVGDLEKDIGNAYTSARYDGTETADSVAVLTGVIGAHQPEGVQPDFRPAIGGFYTVKFSIWGLRWERTHAVAAVRGPVGNFQIFEKPFTKNAAGEWVGVPVKEEKLDMHSWEQNEDFHGQEAIPQIIRATLNGEVLGFYDAPSLTPTVHEIKVWLKPGDKISFHAMTLPAAAAHNWPGYNGVQGYVGPGVAYDWFEATGPLIEEWPPASQQTLFGDQPNTVAKPAAEQAGLMEKFASLAFRRPLSPGEITPYTDIVLAELQRGSAPEEAMLAGYKAILCSPDFLFIGLESGTPATAGNYALASRLSYFLWDALPDATLLALAASGALAQRDILHQQVERMLADPRSGRFINHFTDEWLDLKKIAFTTPDPNLYPEFDPWLMDSILAETRGTFSRMLQQNRSIREVVAADSILINQRLGELYNIKGVPGTALREVKLPPGSPRGGLLTQASVLKVTANGTTSSPILRGVWVMERILGIPRKPVPANVPAIEPDASGATTIRQMIELHRADAACASCHAHMDPHGLALESFDVIGGFRDHYRLAGQAKPDQPALTIHTDTSSYTHAYRFPQGPPVDASGVLPDGQAFTDLNSYRELLLKDEDGLARNLARQLMIYATGAGIRYSDRSAIEAIIAKTKPGKHGLRSLLHEVVASDLFQTK
jgi:Protein of unknown function (DUF1592)/Protein of unknown function (DUF1588)/Protein of unknown function (DUF1587)/Protein of unknown function (DUF1585)/Protein of unknown function (DUF1595)/Planctomycete cytochrome C